MDRKIRWGILSTAAIGADKVIPAMQKGKWSEVTAIASRDIHKARVVAERLGIPRAYGSYEELLGDSDVEAIYNPLPNHLHVPWTIRAAEAGKHVLCEKPIGLNTAEARKLLAVRDRTGVKIQEAFMVRTHPQWLRARALIDAGRIGTLRVVNGFFSYFNANPSNIRNQAEAGGGGLLDIGCYAVSMARFSFAEEPVRALGLIERDPDLGIDRLASVILDFPSGQASFTCSTQLTPYQRMQLCGTHGRIEIEIPFNAPTDKPVRILIHESADPASDRAEVIDIPPCDQYTIQSDLFSQAILEGREQAVPLEDAVKNMAVLDAIFRSASSGRWDDVQLIAS